ncbi:MAG: protein kinase domain-containing protein [Acidobacteriota bacterium]
MSLSAGSRLGAYEIISPLGAGGMGEVYLARDAKLEREVAIKILPEAFTNDPERLARFEREARFLASLSHPNIGAVHGLEESNGVRFLVLELIAGQTLADRVSSGPIELEECLEICCQIAVALEAAHEKGIIHRDLKPSNIKITPEGQVKLLDFGLAKAFALQESSPNLSVSPTLTQQTIREGVILGTAAYMSPEQARGRTVDKRSDIWSFGCVLYECLAGRQAFRGDSVTDVLATIIHKDPDWQALPAETPAAIRELLERLLKKDRNHRFRDIGDARIVIEEVAADPSKRQPVATTGPTQVRGRTREWLGWLTAGILTLIMLPLLAAYFRNSPAEPAVRSAILPPEKSAFDFVGTGLRPSGPPAISPDGRILTFAAPTQDGRRLLWVRPLDSLSARPIAGTENATFPFWSADSRFIGFFVPGKLKKVEATGGPPQTICDASEGRGGTWNSEGVIVFAPSVASSLYRVSASGGVAHPLTKLDDTRRERGHRWPWFLPDGKHFVYLATTFSGGTEDKPRAIFISNLESNENRLLLNANSNVAYASGYLLYARDKVLLAHPFDAGRRQFTEEARPLAEQVQYDAGFGRAVFSVSSDGVLLYQTGTSSGFSQLGMFDRTGKNTDVLGEPLSYQYPAISPDGQRVAVSIPDPNDGNVDLWIHEITRGVRTRFSFDVATDFYATWSPDSSRLAFASIRKGAFDIYQKASDGAGSEQLLLESATRKYPTSWSLDGRFLLYTQRDPKGRGQFDIWVLPLFGDQKPFAFLATDFEEQFGRFSHNGKWVAYMSDESGTNEIYISPFPGPGGKRRVSTAGGAAPRWRRDGKELFYMAPDNNLMVVQVTEAAGGIQTGVPKPLFLAKSGRPDFYDVSADGKRFVMISPREGNMQPLTLVTNWTAGLKR